MPPARLQLANEVNVLFFATICTYHCGTVPLCAGCAGSWFIICWALLACCFCSLRPTDITSVELSLPIDGGGAWAVLSDVFWVTCMHCAFVGLAMSRLHD